MPEAPVLDVTLVLRVAAGDEESFTRLYELTAPRVAGLVRRILGEPHSVEDTVVEVYAQVWKQAGRFDARRGSLWSWLLTLARTRALDRLRHEGRRPDLRAPEPELAEAIADTSTAPDGPLPAAELAAAVRSALSRLPKEQREALEVAYFEGRSYTETAATLGVPEGTIKSRIRLGLAAMRRTLTPFVEGQPA